MSQISQSENTNLFNSNTPVQSFKLSSFSPIYIIFFQYPFFLWASLAVLWCMLVCTSRIYLGMHSIAVSSILTSLHKRICWPQVREGSNTILQNFNPPPGQMRNIPLCCCQNVRSQNNLGKILNFLRKFCSTWLRVGQINTKRVRILNGQNLVGLWIQSRLEFRTLENQIHSKTENSKIWFSNGSVFEWSVP